MSIRHDFTIASATGNIRRRVGASSRVYSVLALHQYLQDRADDAAPQATGAIIFTAQPSVNSTVTINGTAFTFVASGATGNQVNIGANLTATITSLATVLNASVNANVSQATYEAGATAVNNTSGDENELWIVHKTVGSAGESFTLAASTSPASNATVSNSTLLNDDLLDITSAVPSKLDGPRDSAVASRLNLLADGVVAFNLDDTAAQFINFGSIKQQSAAVQYSGLKTIGGIVTASPVYVVQNGSKLTKFWSNGHIQILVKVRTGGTLIDSGNVTAFSRKWGQTYSHFDVNLAAGGESNAALSTALDSNIILTEAQAAALSTKVAVAFGDTTQDLGNGNGGKLYKGTITLSNSCTLQEAYQYLQYLTREDSTATLNSVPGWRYRVLDASYTENAAAPFGTFAGGTFFVARGWWITGVLPAEATRYQLIAHDGTTQVPPNLVGVTISGLTAGQRVLVARDNGSGDILKDEYTPVAASAGATSLTVVEAIKTDTPSSGIIRIKSLPYSYTSFNAGTKTFNGLVKQADGTSGLASNIVTADDVFVPYIDRVATSTSESVSFIYNANFAVRVRVRNGSGALPIIPVESSATVTSAGAQVNVNPGLDV
jgi:hypothetical protein